MASAVANTTPTPGRGLYDRRAARAQRAAAERRVLLQVARELLLLGTQPTLSELCGRARVGRNTVYRHFASLSALFDETLADAEAELHEALRLPTEECRTPRSHLMALCTAWLGFARAQPDTLRLLLSWGNEQVDRALHYEIAQLARQAYAAGLARRPPNEDGAAAICASLRALGQRTAQGRSQLDPAELSDLLARIAFSVLR